MAPVLHIKIIGKYILKTLSWRVLGRGGDQIALVWA